MNKNSIVLSYQPSFNRPENNQPLMLQGAKKIQIVRPLAKHQVATKDKQLNSHQQIQRGVGDSVVSSTPGTSMQAFIQQRTMPPLQPRPQVASLPSSQPPSHQSSVQSRSLVTQDNQTSARTVNFHTISRPNVPTIRQLLDANLPEARPQICRPQIIRPNPGIYSQPLTQTQSYNMSPVNNLQQQQIATNLQSLTETQSYSLSSVNNLQQQTPTNSQPLLQTQSYSLSSGNNLQQHTATTSQPLLQTQSYNLSSVNNLQQQTSTNLQPLQHHKPQQQQQPRNPYISQYQSHMNISQSQQQHQNVPTTMYQDQYQNLVTYSYTPQTVHLTASSNNNNGTSANQDFGLNLYQLTNSYSGHGIEENENFLPVGSIDIPEENHSVPIIPEEGHTMIYPIDISESTLQDLLSSETTITSDEQMEPIEIAERHSPAVETPESPVEELPKDVLSTILVKACGKLCIST